MNFNIESAYIFKTDEATEANWISNKKYPFTIFLKIKKENVN